MSIARLHAPATSPEPVDARRPVGDRAGLLRAGESLDDVLTWAAEHGLPVQGPSAALLLAYRRAHGVARRHELSAAEPLG